MNKQNQIRPVLLRCQWDAIYNKLNGITQSSSDLEKKIALKHHIVKEIRRLSEACMDLPDSSPCLECKEQISIWVPDFSVEQLAHIAQKTGVSGPGVIVSNFIINPLLLKV